MKISFLLVLSHRPEIFRDCLNSLEDSINNAQKISQKAFDYEVILIQNPSTKEMKHFIENSSLPIVQIETQKLTPSAARNKGLEQASGDYLCFLDDDVIVPKNYIQQAIEIITERYSLDVFGGPDQTLPDSPVIEKAIGLTLLSPMATANTRFRHGLFDTSHHGENALILCNLWIKHSFIKKNNIAFDENFLRNEENILIEQMKQKQAQINSIPYFFVYHRKPNNPFYFVKKVFLSGFYRAFSFRQYPQYFRLIYITPSLFIFYLLGLPFFISYFSQLALFPIYLYVFLALLFSLKISFNKNKGAYAPLIFIFQVFINVFYGIGFIFGLFKKP